MIDAALDTRLWVLFFLLGLICLGLWLIEFYLLRSFWKVNQLASLSSSTLNTHVEAEPASFKDVNPE